jgi:hypothetical protein
MKTCTIYYDQSYGIRHTLVAFKVLRGEVSETDTYFLRQLVNILNTPEAP